MMRKQMSRRLGGLQLKKEHMSPTLRNAFVMFAMKLFLLQVCLNFLKGMFQKILFYFTVGHDILYETFRDDHTRHTRSLSDVRLILATCKLLPCLTCTM